MKVKDLIKKLQEFPEDLEIVEKDRSYPENSYWHPISPTLAVVGMRLIRGFNDEECYTISTTTGHDVVVLRR